MSCCRWRGASTRSTLTKLTQKFVWRNKEGIFLKEAAYDDHRMGAHNVNHLVPAKLPEVISANHRVFVMTPNVIHAGLELNDIIDVRSIFHCPVHTTTNAT